LAREPEVLLVADGDHRDSFLHKPAEVVKVDHTDAIDRALGQPTQIIDLTALPPEIISSSSNAETPRRSSPLRKRSWNASDRAWLRPSIMTAFPGSEGHRYIEIYRSLDQSPPCVTGSLPEVGMACDPSSSCRRSSFAASLICLPNVVFLSRIGGHLPAEGRIGAKEIFSRLRGQAERFISFVKLFATQDLR
jgi:hypothetical protein